MRIAKWRLAAINQLPKITPENTLSPAELAEYRALVASGNGAAAAKLFIYQPFANSLGAIHALCPRREGSTVHLEHMGGA